MKFFFQKLLYIKFYPFTIGKNRTEVIDHYTMCTGEEFLDIFRPKNGEGKTLAMELHKALKLYLAVKSLIYISKKISYSKNFDKCEFEFIYVIPTFFF